MMDDTLWRLAAFAWSGGAAAIAELGDSSPAASPKEAVSRLAQACYYPCPLPRRDAQGAASATFAER